jgi:hypothetical protein
LTNGRAVSNAVGNQINPWAASDGAGGAIVAWGDGRAAPSGEAWGGDVYAARLVSDQPTPTLISLVDVRTGRDKVSLRWFLEASSFGEATLYRRGTVDEWTVLARATPNGLGLVSYEDRDVVAGAEYGYRLGVLHGLKEYLSEAVWINIPQVPELALHGFRPNPSAGSLGVAFGLGDARPARLEIMDLSGRRVFVREVGALGIGEHLVTTEPANSVPPGVYFARLSQGGRCLIARGVVAGHN